MKTSRIVLNGIPPYPQKEGYAFENSKLSS